MDVLGYYGNYFYCVVGGVELEVKFVYYNDWEKVIYVGWNVGWLLVDL